MKHGSSPAWLVIDPRGFLVRISFQNLQKILQVTGITEGLIQEKCIWARDDSQTKMQLIPVNTVEYTDAVKNTALIEEKVDIKEVSIGDKVLLQNGLQGTYLGTLSLYRSLQVVSQYRGVCNKYKVNKEMNRQLVEVAPNKIFSQVDTKILKILEKAKEFRSVTDVMDDLNSRLHLCTFSPYPLAHWHTQYDERVGLVTTDRVPAPSVSFVEITRMDAFDYHSDTVANHMRYSPVLLEDENGDRFLIYYPHFSTTHTSAAEVFTIKVEPFDINSKVTELVLEDNYDRYWDDQKKLMNTRKLDKFTKFYKIVKHVKNKSYV
jgi:hypothetical protein